MDEKLVWGGVCPWDLCMGKLPTTTCGIPFRNTFLNFIWLACSQDQMIIGQIDYSSVWAGHFGLTGVIPMLLCGPSLNHWEDFLLSVLIHFLHINMSESKSFSIDLTTIMSTCLVPKVGICQYNSCTYWAFILVGSEKSNNRHMDK